MKKTAQESVEDLRRESKALIYIIMEPVFRFFEREQFIFRKRIIGTPYWDVKEVFIFGIMIYCKRFNIEPGHE